MHPPMPPSPFPPYQQWYTDVEPAYERPAECECHFPQTPDNCLCVTEDDVNRWNSTYSAFSALIESGINVSALTSAAQVAASAYLWNQAYTAVSSYSGLWNSVSAVSAKTDILADDLVDLSGKFTNHMNGTDYGHYVDGETIIGKGIASNPWRLARNVFSAYEHNYEDVLKQIKDLETNMGNCEENITKSIAELSAGHSNNYELILQLMGITPETGGSLVVWVRENGMNSLDANTYKNLTTTNHMYYKPYYDSESK